MASEIPDALPAWWVLLPPQGSIAVRNWPFSIPNGRCTRVPPTYGNRELKSFDALVWARPGNRDVIMLKAYGFSWWCSLAALPSLASPRWFISTKTKTMAPVGMQLYTPQYLRGKLFKWLAGTANLPALYSGNIPWINNRLLIGLREPPAFIRACDKWAGRETIDFNFASGTAGLFQTATVQVIGRDAKPGLFVKVASTDRARRRIKNEALLLDRINSHASCYGHVPRLFFSGEFNGCCLLAQSVLMGKSGPPYPDRMLVSFLEQLIGKERIPLGESIFWKHIYNTVLSRPDANIYQPEIHKIPRDILIPKTIMHGDFTPWNLVIRKNHVQLMDWESGVFEGIPFFDLFHYVVRYGLLIRRWSGQVALEQTLAFMDTALFSLYRRKTGIDSDTVPRFLELYLIDSLLDEDLDLTPHLRERYLFMLKRLRSK